MWYEKSEKIVLDSLKLGRPSTDTERIRLADKAIGYYENNKNYQLNDLALSYQGQFKKVETWNAIPKVAYNLMRPVCDTLSAIYDYPVARDYEDEAQGKIFSAIEDYNSMMAIVDLYTLVSGCVAVRPIWDETLKKITYALYYGNEIDITPDPVDPSKVMQLILTWHYGGNKIEHIWEKDRFVELVDGKAQTPAAEQVNIYNRIPAVIFTNRYQTKRVLDFPASDLVQGNLTLNWLATIINDCVPIQIAGLLVTKGAKSGMDIRVGQRARLDLPGDDGADAKYINPGADIEKGISTINLNLEMFFSQRNIPESAIRATQLSGKSGLAFVAEQESLVKYYKRRQNVFGKKDAELAALSVLVDTYHRTKKLMDPEVPAVKYHEFKTPMSAEERAQWDWEMLNGISTEADYLMAKNFGMTKDEAIKIIAENKAGKMPRFVPPDRDIEDNDTGI